MFIGEVAFTSRASLVQREVAPKAPEGLSEEKRILILRTIPHPLRGSPLYTKGPFARHLITSNSPINQNLTDKLMFIGVFALAL